MRGEILHLTPEWPVIFALYSYLFLSFMVTFLAVKEQMRRKDKKDGARDED